MKIKAPSGELLTTLQMAQGAISTNPVMPILEDFLFIVSAGELHISATDLETSLHTKMNLTEASTDGKIAVPARILLDTLKALPEQPVSLDVNEETLGITLTSNYGKYRLAGEKGEDYPRIPAPDNLSPITVKASHLGEAIKSTLFATSTDDMRPSMTGVYMQIEEKKITAVATDAHKLVKFEFPIQGNVEASQSFIIPRKSLQLIKNILPDEGDVQMAFNKENVFFSFDKADITCRLIDARYPDYQAVIPLDNPFTLTIDRARLQDSLKRIAIYSNKTTNQVVLQINVGSLTMSAQDLDFANEATEQLPCQYEGDSLEIAFNARFLIEMLGVLQSEEVKFVLVDAKRATVLLPADKPTDGTDVLMIVMPVMVTN